MRFVDTKVVFREVPDRITLAVNISNCPIGCPGCHSKYLWEDVGEILDRKKLLCLIDANPGINCVSFMGGDAEPETVRNLAKIIKETRPGLETCWYSGRSLEKAEGVIPFLDFIKIGPFIEEYGPLDAATTNQRFYQIGHTEKGPVFSDWTPKFQKKLFE
ncbi:MAG: anaerobic ribonucleoside-triphosphate reductase activating protein [Bacteroidales bacterium]|nr:anaerobic ribonucleoside-triphosphate reductase activating protein [Candidatus Cacconaster scatequi]